jgi:hypothetical protein
MAFGETAGGDDFLVDGFGDSLGVFFEGFGDCFGVFLALDSGSSFADFLSGFLGEDLRRIHLSYGDEVSMLIQLTFQPFSQAILSSQLASHPRSMTKFFVSFSRLSSPAMTRD